jgi:type IV secretion system protein VirD4
MLRLLRYVTTGLFHVGLRGAYLTTFLCLFAVLGMLGFLFPFFGLLFLGIVIHRYRNRPAEISTCHGSARWAEFWDLWQHGMLQPWGLMLGRTVGSLRPSFKEVWVALATWPLWHSQAAIELARHRQTKRQGAVVRLSDDRIPHVAVFGSSGCGKSSCLAIPNLMQDPASLLVCDPKAELFQQTAHYRERYLGQKIIRIDPFGIVNSRQYPAAKFNPLSLNPPNAAQAIDNARRLANALIVRNEQASEPFWDNGAQILIQSIISLLQAHAEPEHVNLNRVRDILCSPELLREAHQAMLQSGEAGGLLKRMAGQLSHFQGKTLASILTVAGSHMEFLDSLPVANTVQDSSFDPRQLLDQPVTIYLCLPVDRLRELRGLQRIIVTSLINMIFEAGESRQRLIRFYLDEAATLGEIEALYSALVFGRSFGIRLFFLYQSLGQIEQCFPKAKAQDFRAVTASVFTGTNDFHTAKEVSQWIGQTTVHSTSRQSSNTYGSSENRGMHEHSSGTNRSYSTSTTYNETARALIQPEEVLQLPTELAIALIPNQRPILIEKIPYYHGLPSAPSKLSRIAECVKLLLLISGNLMLMLGIWISYPHQTGSHQHPMPASAPQIPRPMSIHSNGFRPSYNNYPHR